MNSQSDQFHFLRWQVSLLFLLSFLIPNIEFLPVFILLNEKDKFGGLDRG
jgi:hypothetical protein